MKAQILRVCDIIQHELGLADSRIWVAGQKVDIPTDSGVFITVGVGQPKAFGSTRTEASTSGMEARQYLNMMVQLSIDVFGKTLDTLDAAEQVILALKSHYSIQTQETYGFLLASIPQSCVNLSGMEGAAIPYRFNLSVAVQYSISKTQSIDYFETFTNDPQMEA